MCWYTSELMLFELRIGFKIVGSTLLDSTKTPPCWGGSGVAVTTTTLVSVFITTEVTTTVSCTVCTMGVG